MALARIITRSQVCAKQLAADLLARGYAVEIVTPDSVPGNNADLELRVEEHPGKQLVASVHAHDGRRSASFEFRHQLRAPIADFLRKTQETTEVVYLSADPVTLVEPCDELVELQAKAPQPEIKTVSAPAVIPLDSGAELSSADLRSADSPPSGLHSSDLPPAELSPQEAAPPPLFPEPRTSQPVETIAVATSHFAKRAEGVPIPSVPTPSTIAQPLVASSNASPEMVQPKRGPQARKRPARREWRAALAFTGMVSLALILGLGIGRSDKTSAPFPGEASAEKVEAPPIDAYDAYPSAAAPEDDASKDAAAVSGQASGLPSSQSPIHWGWDGDHTAKNSTVDNAENAVVTAAIVNKKFMGKTTTDKIRSSGQNGHDLIARDTVTYFVERHQPHPPKAQPPNSLARRDPASHKHSSGVVAANTVTYLNKPDPKTAK